MIHLVWGFSLLFSSIFVFLLFQKKDNRVTVKYLCLFGASIGAILGILNIFVQKYDSYCSICIGVLCIFFTYYDNKKHPVSKITNAYISSLQGYVAGIGFLLYGIFHL